LGCGFFGVRWRRCRLLGRGRWLRSGGEKGRFRTRSAILIEGVCHVVLIGLIAVFAKVVVIAGGTLIPVTCEKTPSTSIAVTIVLSRFRCHNGRRLRGGRPTHGPWGGGTSSENVKEGVEKVIAFALGGAGAYHT
jgi:hypothetical protein